jgi:hypothetical protein
LAEMDPGKEEDDREAKNVTTLSVEKLLLTSKGAIAHVKKMFKQHKQTKGHHV